MAQTSRRIIDHDDAHSFFKAAVHLRMSGRMPAGTYELPAAVAAAVDRDDPDRDLILDALHAMGWVGFDMTEVETLEQATKAARNKAARIVRELADGTFGREVEPLVPALPSPEDTRLTDEAARADLEARSVVYYMRMGNRVKIGFSTNLQKRLAVINPEELIVTEPGGPMVEKRRHRQFADLRTHGEWFRFEGALISHIAELRAEAA